MYPLPWLGLPVGPTIIVVGVTGYVGVKLYGWYFAKAPVAAKVVAGSNTAEALRMVTDLTASAPVQEVALSEVIAVAPKLPDHSAVYESGKAIANEAITAAAPIARQSDYFDYVLVALVICVILFGVAAFCEYI